ncbi:lipoprotein-releasing ABC transporter permease subunit [Aestuariibacter halophilus]|uniref:Lipoprotein-releasing ABC transporter permease subunit n=1 Tax=Fluctibacter halophilus TaxID=226011 RepID=A0ABS8G5N7_9ALTE|nr:lipoprotein-releasing ABC transporter permease subunit [Aestuariibacter halophilus]MCC2615875.1 lipoprotein-releasing ABC transporter permease subunit [Aestuariibacter halophilus]
MMSSLSAFIGLRYAKAQRGHGFIAFINLFSVAGIALGLMALITVLSVMNGFEAQLKTRLLGLTPHLMVDTRDADAQQAEQLAELPGVAAVSPMIEGEGVVQSPSNLQGVMLQGIEPGDTTTYQTISDNMLMGSLQQLQPGEYGVVIGRRLASTLNVRPGDGIRLMAGVSVYTPFGRVPSQRIFKVVGVYDMGSELDDKVVMLHRQDLARLMRQPEQALSQTRVTLYDAFDYQTVSQQLSLPVHSWRTRQGPLFDAVKMEKNMMALMLMLIIAVAVFNTLSALVMVVTEKQGDVAILRTQGMTATDIVRIFLYSGLYNGLKGTLIGLAGGILLVWQLNPLLALLDAPIMLAANGQGLPIDVRPGQIVVAVLLLLAMCFLATLYPAYRALRVQPAVALKYE